MTSNDQNHEAVLEHVAWVQRLAYRLCADTALAEDVSQESLLSAFREPRRRGLDLRQWLVGVVRNQVRMARRASGRRRDREQAASVPDDVASPAELVERAANHRTVVEAVTGLPEIYRTALLRRYFDDLGPARIAALEGVPEATVKTRLRRGLEMLRERLADELGDEPGRRDQRAWIAALVPMALVERRRREATAAAGAGGVGGLAVWSALAAILMAATWLSFSAWGGGSVSAPAASSSRASEQVVDDPAPPTPGERQPLAAPSGGEVERQRKPARMLSVVAEVCDVDGRPVPDVALFVRAFDGPRDIDGAVGRCGRDGRRTFEIPPRQAQLLAEAPGWATVVPGTVFPYAASTVVRVVVARERSVSGLVTGPDGAPIAGALVTYGAETQLGSRLDVPLDLASRRRWEVRTDAAGAFALRVPEMPGASMRAEAWDHESATVPLTARGDAVADCLLPLRANGTSWLQGVVRAADGAPAANAVVACGAQAARCESDGRFRIDVGAADAADLLWVVAPGCQPASSALGRVAPDELRELRLQEPARTITGRVVDAAGRPARGVQVDVLEPCSRAFLPSADGNALRAVPLEHVSLGRPTRATTDADGRFAIGGLADRAYRLVVRDPEALAVSVVEAVVAPALGLELPRPEPEARMRVAGRLLDDLGQPLRGAPVTAIVTHASGAGAQASCATDENGRFAFSQSVPRSAVLRIAAGADYAPLDVPLHERPDATDLQLVARRSGSFYLRRSDPDGPPIDGFRLETADGRPVRLQRVEGRICFTIDGGGLDGGRSPVVRAPAGTHLLVLLHGGREVRRQPLDLRPGPTVRVDL